MSKRSDSDRVFSEDQRRNLLALLNMIIPPHPGKGLPGAGELDFAGYVVEFEPSRIEAVRLELNELNQRAEDQCNATFACLEQAERDRLIDELRAENVQFAQNIVALTMACYYQDDKVMVALGMEARAPYPKGNEVESGDLSLLSPVRERKRMYRDA